MKLIDLIKGKEPLPTSNKWGDDFETEAYVRTALGDEKWSRWYKAKLFLGVRKKTGKGLGPIGDFYNVSVRDWAEYREQDWCPTERIFSFDGNDGEWRLQIRGVTGLR